MLSSSEVVAAVRRHIESQFPKVCAKCGRRFASLREYLQATVHAGDPVSYDAAAGHSDPNLFLGTFAFAHCRCGNTLAISSEGMPKELMAALREWSRAEVERRGISIRELLRSLRDEIDRRALAEQTVERG